MGDDEAASFRAVLKGFLTPYLGIGLILLVAVCIGLVALFVLHSVTFWLSADPQRAFLYARRFAGFYSSGWNSLRTMLNGFTKVAFYWVPQWNTMAKHMIEPGIYIGLDVISQVFAHKHYEGLIKDVDNTEIGGVPFRGHYCGEAIRGDQGTVLGFEAMDRQTVKYCSYAAAEQWASDLGVIESADPKNAIQNGTTLLLSTAHARRLASIIGEEVEGGSMFGAINLGPILEAVQEIAGVYTMIQTTLWDIGAHLIFTILSEAAVAIWNLAQVLIREVAAGLMVLMNSGAVKFLLKLGVDLLMILVVHVLVPLLLAVLDLINCLINMAQPATWDEQLICSTHRTILEPVHFWLLYTCTFDSLCRSREDLFPRERRRRYAHTTFLPMSYHASNSGIEV